MLTELINDEEDDELSNKAFECLEALGPKVISDLMRYLNLATGRVSTKFARSRTLIVDIYRKRERHIYLKGGVIPNLRQVGPQDPEDLIDSNVYASLQKILPVMNGLLQCHSPQTQEVQDLIKVFSFNLPLDVYLSALSTTLSGL